MRCMFIVECLRGCDVVHLPLGEMQLLQGIIVPGPNTKNRQLRQYSIKMKWYRCCAGRLLAGHFVWCTPRHTMDIDDMTVGIVTAMCKKTKWISRCTQYLETHRYRKIVSKLRPLEKASQWQQRYGLLNPLQDFNSCIWRQLWA